MAVDNLRVRRRPSNQMADDNLTVILDQGSDDSLTFLPVQMTKQGAKTAGHKSDFPVYKMSSPVKGICLIINNMEFDDPESLSTLESGKQDKEKLMSTFKGLDFVVRRYYFENLTADQIEAKLKEVAKKDHSEYDCFVCCITSHGGKRGIYGRDGKTVDIRRLTSLLRASNCKSLAGKPKLFFVDACRGGGKQQGVKAVAENVDQEEKRLLTSQERPIPDEADFLLGYATADDYVSYCDDEKGSRFISALTKKLDKYADLYDILEILTLVNYEVNAKHPHRFQTPAPMFTLRGKLYLGKSAMVYKDSGATASPTMLQLRAKPGEAMNKLFDFVQQDPNKALYLGWFAVLCFYCLFLFVFEA